MEDNFAFLLPVMMGTFSVVFFLLTRLSIRLPSAMAWCVAFGSGACAFSVAMAPIPLQWQALVSDLLFFISFYAYGEGLLIQFKRPRVAVLRGGFAALSMLVNIYVVLWLQSVEKELLLVDISLSALLAAPVLMVLNRPRNSVDKALVTVAALVVLDTFVRVMVFNVILKTSDAMADFTASDYAFFMQVSGAALGLCFALAALGSVLMDIVAGYRDAAELDPLTGLFNRRGFENALTRLQPDQRRHGVVLTCDIDHFKQINDSYGHAAGDRVIAELARLLAENLPQEALSARFGGEEFIGFAPGASLAEGKALAQTICDVFAESRWTGLGIERRITVSFGVATLISVDRSIHDAIARADRALYLAKAAGRNQVASEAMLPMAGRSQPDPLADLAS